MVATNAEPMMAMMAHIFIAVAWLSEWGAMLSAGRSFFRDHWFVETFPGLAIMLAVFAFNLFGDGLRDALDPRLKT